MFVGRTAKSRSLPFLSRSNSNGRGDCLWRSPPRILRLSRRMLSSVPARGCEEKAPSVPPKKNQFLRLYLLSPETSLFKSEGNNSVARETLSFTCHRIGAHAKTTPTSTPLLRICAIEQTWGKGAAWTKRSIASRAFAASWVTRLLLPSSMRSVRVKN